MARADSDEEIIEEDKALFDFIDRVVKVRGSHGWGYRAQPSLSPAVRNLRTESCLRHEDPARRIQRGRERPPKTHGPQWPVNTTSASWLSNPPDRQDQNDPAAERISCKQKRIS